MLLRRQPAVLQLQPVVLHGLPWQRLVCLILAIVMVDSPARLARRRRQKNGSKTINKKGAKMQLCIIPKLQTGVSANWFLSRAVGTGVVVAGYGT
jgi:hypothetical protein